MENERLYGIYLPNTNINKKIISDRLTLVPYLIDDMECMDTDKKYWDYLGKNPLEFAWLYHDEFISYDEHRHKGLREDFKLSFIIKENATNECIGNIDLNFPSGNSRTYNLAYFVFPDYRRKGYAKEAVLALLNAVKNKEVFTLADTIREGIYEKKAVDLQYLQLSISADNIASNELIKSLGFEFTTMTWHCDYEYNGMPVDVNLYELHIR